jgi:hypothetical protein
MPTFYIGQTDYIEQLNALAGSYGGVANSSTFGIGDATDSTKVAEFAVSGFPTATTYTFTLPAITGQLATLGNLTQTFTGPTTYSNATFTVTGTSLTFGNSTAATTINIGTGATLTATTKTVNIGTGGVSGSTTTINIGTSAGGTSVITFNAAPVSAVGYKVGTTLSSDVNTLDYYQEGTFTPVIAGTTTAGAGTYTLQTGTYTRIGNRVMFSARVTWTAHTGTGNFTITGLPFASSASTPTSPFSVIGISVTYTGTLVAYASTGTSVITLAQQTSAATLTSLTILASGDLLINGSYMV